MARGGLGVGGWAGLRPAEAGAGGVGRRARWGIVRGMAVRVSYAPPGLARGEMMISTGSAAGGCAAAPLHPWLPSSAPAGAQFWGRGA